MKNKKIIPITIMLILCTTGLGFANEIKILKKDNQGYISVKALIKNIDEKIIIDKESSFAKVGQEYYPIKSKKIDGFKVPVNEKPIYENKEVYINEDFLKNSKIVDYKVKDNKIIINEKNESEPTKKIEKIERPKEEIIDNIQTNKENYNKDNTKVPKLNKPIISNKPIKPIKSENNNHDNTNENITRNENSGNTSESENNPENNESNNNNPENNNNENEANQNSDSTNNN